MSMTSECPGILLHNYDHDTKSPAGPFCFYKPRCFHGVFWVFKRSCIYIPLDVYQAHPGFKTCLVALGLLVAGFDLQVGICLNQPFRNVIVLPAKRVYQSNKALHMC